MIGQCWPQCAMCSGPIIASDTVLDYTPFGLGYTQGDSCQRTARELAYERLGEAWGLTPVDCQCMHGVGEAWTTKDFYWHDRWDNCTVQGRCGYPILDHMRMWIVQEGSPWSSITEPGLKILTSEPYPPEAQQLIPHDSRLWYEVGSEFRMLRYDDVSIHHPTTDVPGRSILHVWARPGVGDTDEKREWRTDFNRREGQGWLYG